MKAAGITALLILLLVGGLLLRVRLSADIGLHKWDERFHALVAKNVIADPLEPTLYSHPALPYDYTFQFGDTVDLFFRKELVFAENGTFGSRLLRYKRAAYRIGQRESGD